MTSPDNPPARFTISAAARGRIAALRAAFDAASADKAAVVSIGWANVVANDGSTHGAVAVSFYPASQRDAGMRAAIQVVSGVEVIFFASPDMLPRFDGSVVDFDAESGFFLRGS